MKVEIPAQLKKPNVKAITLWQAVFVVVITALTWAINTEVAKAFLYGSFIFIIPNAFFVWHSYKYTGPKNSKQVVGSMYRGQAIKLVLTFLMFALMLKEIPIEKPWIVFLSYALNAVMHLLMSLIVLKNHQN